MQEGPPPIRIRLAPCGGQLGPHHLRSTQTTNWLRVEKLNSFKTQWLGLTGILLVATMTTLAMAQVGESDSRSNGTSSNGTGIVKDEIPAAALKTEEGRKMAERLGFLRRSQASMGPKHPAFPGIKAEIETIRDRLGINGSGSGGALAPSGQTLNSMSDDELRQLIRRMALRIESLEQRLYALERRLEVF